jgi:penicillin V acylase-like amidase (Ntn superfamily)
MAPWDFLTWALTNFATVAEVREAAKGISIIPVTAPMMDMVPPFHYTLHDATGASLVVEPVGGTLKIYDNPFGVMTNAPEFDWHSPLRTTPSCRRSTRWRSTLGTVDPPFGRAWGRPGCRATRRRRASSVRSATP